jgi:putative addiction module CopG family antidote
LGCVNTKNWYNEAMTISLTDELDAYVEAEVRSGRYKTNSEVIRAGLRALAEQQSHTWLREGLEALNRGDKVEARSVVNRLRNRLKQPIA